MLCVGGTSAPLRSATICVFLLICSAALCSFGEVRGEYVEDDGADESSWMESGNNFEMPDDIGKRLVVELVNSGLDLQWPSENVLSSLGAVSGVSIGPDGDLFLFQRGDHQWTAGTFNKDNVYTGDQKAPIKEDTILQFSQNLDENGVKKSFGGKKFFMPHGITVDQEGNVWVTDVALHQVMKFPKGKTEPTLVLGKAFEPGHDVQHFCKPTHVVVAKNGDFFVADGYCNSRILKFSKEGRLVRSWGKPENGDGVLDADELSIPHALVLLEERDELCVADREHGRVQCYNAGIKNSDRTGNYTGSIDARTFGPTFALAYNQQKNVLAILGGARDEISRSDIGFYHLQQKKFVDVLRYPAEEGFGDGHSLAVSPDGERLLVGSLTNVCPTEGKLCLEAMINRNMWLFID